jgi:D-aminopeptidase
VEDIENSEEGRKVPDYIPLIRGIRKHVMMVMRFWMRKEAAVFVAAAYRLSGRGET